mmetsp:Transcript_37870/g.95746  ORF Transcript_37870/g.95746 Transcript_37870/m.95746 type:complete len:259 (-) Transcript_37870:633-1409(-)
MADKAAADGAAVERGRERADGSSPSDGGESPTRVSSMVHQRQDKTPQVSENSTQALLLESMGLRKAFIASVQSVRKDEIVITTRVDSAHAMVEEAGPGEWAIIEGLQDTTYRRQTMAAYSLGTLIAHQNGNNEDGPRAATVGWMLEQSSADEVRVRKIVLSIQDVLNSGGDIGIQEEACRNAQSLASKSVSWIRPHPTLFRCGALQEVCAVLEEQEGKGLNSSQLEILKMAASRTLTLLKVRHAILVPARVAPSPTWP